MGSLNGCLIDPLEKKIDVAKNNIAEWYEYFEGKVYVAFSGGKDSQVLLHLVRNMFPDVPAVYFQTGLEWPDTHKIVNRTENVIKMMPRIPFHKVIEKYGYPIISKQVANKIFIIRHSQKLASRTRQIHWNTIHQLPKKYRYLLAAPFKISAKCCTYMKKEPGQKFVNQTGRKPMIGVLHSDSRLRYRSWERFGCNAFSKKGLNGHGDGPESRPIMSWTSDDVWAYIRKNGIEYARLYDMGWRQTGCMYCGYGLGFEEEPNRFQKMKELYPKHYRFVIEKLKFGEVFDFIGAPYK